LPPEYLSSEDLIQAAGPVRSRRCDDA